MAVTVYKCRTGCAVAACVYIQSVDISQAAAPCLNLLTEVTPLVPDIPVEVIFIVVELSPVFFFVSCLREWLGSLIRSYVACGTESVYGKGKRLAFLSAATDRIPVVNVDVFFLHVTLFFFSRVSRSKFQRHSSGFPLSIFFP